MIEHLNDHTVRLTPDTKRLSHRRPKAKPRGVVVGKPKRSTWEGKITALAADALKDAMEKKLWLSRQYRRSADYEAALEEKGCSKSEGIFGWSCPEGTRVMRQDERLPF